MTGTVNLTNEWDKTFPKSAKINHEKVTFRNRYGITLAADMVNGSKYTDNKELLIIPDAVHTDLYDGGGRNAIPFDKLESFFKNYLEG